MKKKVVVMLAGILAITNLNIVKAASLCSVEDQARLNKVAANVKATYVEAKEALDPSLFIITDETEDTEFFDYYFQIIFTNITKDLYVKVTNDYNKDVKFIRYSDTENGTYTLNWYNLDSVVRFTYEVYSSSETKCRDEKYFTNYIVTPMYNDFHNSIICEGITDYLPCQKYLTVNMKYDEQYNKIVEYVEMKNKQLEEKKNKKWHEKIGDFIKKHKIAFIAGGSIIVIAGVATTIVVVKRKREDVI